MFQKNMWKTNLEDFSTPFHIGRDGGLSTLCHGCGFDYQLRVLKAFPGPISAQKWRSLTMSLTGMKQKI